MGMSYTCLSPSLVSEWKPFAMDWIEKVMITGCYFFPFHLHHIVGQVLYNSDQTQLEVRKMSCKLYLGLCPIFLHLSRINGPMTIYITGQKHAILDRAKQRFQGHLGWKEGINFTVFSPPHSGHRLWWQKLLVCCHVFSLSAFHPDSEPSTIFGASPVWLVRFCFSGLIFHSPNGN